MKRFLFIVAIIATLCSCQKASNTTDVTIGYSFVEEGSMTKADYRENVADFLRGCSPNEIDITLTKGGVATTATTLHSVSLDFGEYAVTADYIPDEYYETYGKGQLSKFPSFGINDKITVDSTTKNLTVKATFKSSAIIIPSDEISAVEYEGDNGWCEFPTDLSSFGFRYVFVNGSDKLKLRLTAVDNTVYTDGAITLTLANDKYYIVHLNGSEVVGIDFPAWTGGDYTAQ